MTQLNPAGDADQYRFALSTLDRQPDRLPTATGEDFGVFYFQLTFETEKVALPSGKQIINR